MYWKSNRGGAGRAAADLRVNRENRNKECIIRIAGVSGGKEQGAGTSVWGEEAGDDVTGMDEGSERETGR